MSVRYEWDVETVTDDDVNDVEDHNFQTSYANCLKFVKECPAPEGRRYDVVLVRDSDDCKAWAYIDNGKLPESFEDAYQRPVAKVPHRFIKEVAV